MQDPCKQVSLALLGRLPFSTAKRKKHARVTHDYSTPRKKRQQPHILENNKLIQQSHVSKERDHEGTLELKTLKCKKPGFFFSSKILSHRRYAYRPGTKQKAWTHPTCDPIHQPLQTKGVFEAIQNPKS